MLRIVALIALAAAAWAAEPVRLQPYPQKLRTFYAAGDPQVPAALRNDAGRPPVGDTTAITVAGDGAVWIGTREGLVRFDAKAPPRDRWQYFAGRRYLPDDEVVSLEPAGAAGVWVLTRTGVSEIRLAPMSLARKADSFEQRVRDRHNRYGMVADSHLAVPGDLASNRLSDNDNDGLWTAMYAAAECFRYAATQSPEALKAARQAVEAVLFLEQVTGKPGLPARSYIKKGETRGAGGQWHWTPDGQIEWKGDTSSDEIVGHFYIFGIAWDLLPDADLKKRIAGAAGRIMDHILDNGLKLIDVTGQPTYWGRWDEEYFASPRGTPDSPLNALEILSFLRTAHHITGNARYEKEYQRLANERKYLARAARYRELREEINYSDEELAMLPFYGVFRYEKNPEFLAVYRQALDQWWENIQREKNPLWTLIYLTANPDAAVDLEGSVWMLYRYPMDLVKWGVKNSHRRDVEMVAATDRFRRPQAKTLLPPDERAIMKWNANPFVVDSGGGGQGEDDGAAFLLPYWMGRYHKWYLGE